jgi:hypothetical protein
MIYTSSTGRLVILVDPARILSSISDVKNTTTNFISMISIYVAFDALYLFTLQFMHALDVHHKVFLPRVHKQYLVSINGPTMMLCRCLFRDQFDCACSIDRLSNSSGMYSGSYVSFITSITSLSISNIANATYRPTYFNSYQRIQMNLILGCTGMNIMHIDNCWWIPRIIMIHGLAYTHYWYAPCFIDQWCCVYSCELLHQCISNCCSASNTGRFFRSIDADILHHVKDLTECSWTTIEIQNYDSTSLSSPWRWCDC